MAKKEDQAAAQTAMVKQEDTIQALLKRYEPTIKAALPAHLSPERMLSIARTAIAINPGLRRCTPLSVIAGVVLASRLGLECDGLLGEAYLIPRWNRNTGRDEASFQLGYKGKHKLSLQHPDVEHVETRLIYEKDKYSLVYEPAPKFCHEPALGNRGAVLGAYTYIRYKDGRVEVFEPMTTAEALDIRDRFGPRNKAGELVGPWVTDTNEMIRKTALHRHWKWMPKAVEMHAAMRAETRLDAGEPIETVVLDLPTGDSESASTAGATDANAEDLKRRLDAAKKQRTQSSQNPQNQGQPTNDAAGGAAGGVSPGPAVPGAEGGGDTPPKSEPPMAPTSSPSPQSVQEIREFGDLPDTLSVDDPVIAHQGYFWERNDDNTAWRKVPPKPNELPNHKRGGGEVAGGEKPPPGETASGSQPAGTTREIPASPRPGFGATPGAFDFGGKSR